MRLRTYLVLLIVLTLLPAVGVVGLALALFHRQTREVVESGLLDTARALSLAVDREVGAGAAVLRVLAAEPMLAAGDLAGFRRQAESVLPSQPTWENIVLYDPAGRQLVNLRLPAGAPLPSPPLSAHIERAVRTRTPQASDLLMGAVVGRPVIQIVQAVERRGAVVYVVGATLRLAALSNVLVAQQLPPESIGSLVDRNGMIIGRTRAVERFVGPPATPDLAAQMRAGREGRWTAVSPEGARMYAAFSTSRVTGWTIAVGVPFEALDSPLRRSVLLLVGAGVATILLGALIALLLARRVSGQILGLSRAAAAVGPDAPFAAPPSAVLEIDAVSGALVAADERRRAAEARTAGLLEETERRRGAAESLVAVGATLSQSLDPETVARAVVATLMRLLSPDAAAVYRADETGSLVSLALESRGPRWSRSLDARSGAIGLAMRERRVVRVPDVLNDPAIEWTADARARLARSAHRAVLAAPLCVRDVPIGGVAVRMATGHVFSDEAVDLVRGLADYAAAALENARLFAELRAAYDDLSQAQRQLAQSQTLETIGRLAGGVAHDFNNLLAVIVTRCHILKRELAADARARDGVEQIRRTAERAAELTRQLLAFGRRQLLRPRRVDLERTVADWLDLLRSMAGEDVALSFEPGAMSPWVTADPAQLQGALITLIARARDAMPSGGRVVIATASCALPARPDLELEAGRYVMLSVTDSGDGMDPETRARVFEPFFGTDAVGTEAGLRLASVYGMVRQTGGGIAVESAPGRGTTFEIYLPAAAPAAPPDDEPAAAAPASRGSTVLVVEDDAEVRDLTRELLEADGFRVLAAEDAEAALAIAAGGGDIDLLLSDVVMPGMSGGELAQRLTASRPGLRVVYMSGYADESLVRHGVLEPGPALLQKPFDPQTLLRTVRELVGSVSGARR